MLTSCQQSSLAVSTARAMNISYEEGMSWQDVAYKATKQTLEIIKPKDEVEFTFSSSTDFDVIKKKGNNSCVYSFKQKTEDASHNEAKYHATIIYSVWEKQGLTKVDIPHMFEIMFGVHADELANMNTHQLAKLWGELYCNLYLTAKKCTA